LFEMPRYISDSGRIIVFLYTHDLTQCGWGNMVESDEE